MWLVYMFVIGFFIVASHLSGLPQAMFYHLHWSVALPMAFMGCLVLIPGLIREIIVYGLWPYLEPGFSVIINGIDIVKEGDPKSGRSSSNAASFTSLFPSLLQPSPNVSPSQSLRPSRRNSPLPTTRQSPQQSPKQSPRHSPRHSPSPRSVLRQSPLASSRGSGQPQSNSPPLRSAQRHASPPAWCLGERAPIHVPPGSRMKKQSVNGSANTSVYKSLSGHLQSRWDEHLSPVNNKGQKRKDDRVNLTTIFSKGGSEDIGGRRRRASSEERLSTRSSRTDTQQQQQQPRRSRIRTTSECLEETAFTKEEKRKKRLEEQYDNAARSLLPVIQRHLSATLKSESPQRTTSDSNRPRSPNSFVKQNGT